MRQLELSMHIRSDLLTLETVNMNISDVTLTVDDHHDVICGRCRPGTKPHTTADL